MTEPEVDPLAKPPDTPKPPDPPVDPPKPEHPIPPEPLPAGPRPWNVTVTIR